MTDLSRGQKLRLDSLTPSLLLEVALATTFPRSRTVDFACFGLDDQGRLGDERYMVFYNQRVTPCGGVSLLGGQGQDHERFQVDLARLPAAVHRLVFTAAVDGEGDMSELAQGHLRLVVAGREVAAFRFWGADFRTEKALIVAELYRKDGWRLAATGQGFAGGLAALLRQFGGDVAEPKPVPAAPPSRAAAPTSPPPAPSPPPPRATGPTPPAPAPFSRSQGNMSSVQHQILHPGAFPLLKVRLAAGESLKAEAGAMVSMSNTLDVDGRLEGGLLGGLGRMLSGEKFFFQTLTARRGPGEVTLAPAMPGDIQVLELDGRETWVLQKDGFFAGSQSLEITTKMQNLAQGLFSGEGFFVIRVSGKGALFVSSYGAIETIELAAGEEVIIDNAHLVAWPERMEYRIERAASGWISSFTSGEGLVCRFQGPGRVLIQTRNPRSFGSWVRQFLPASG